MTKKGLIRPANDGFRIKRGLSLVISEFRKYGKRDKRTQNQTGLTTCFCFMPWIFFFFFFFPGREAKQESKAAILLFPFLDHVLGDKRVSNTNPGFSDYLICFNCSVC